MKLIIKNKKVLSEDIEEGLKKIAEEMENDEWLFDPLNHSDERQTFYFNLLR